VTSIDTERFRDELLEERRRVEHALATLRDEHPGSLDEEVEDLRRHGRRVRVARDVAQQDRELVAAHPRDGVGLADGAMQPLGDGLEQLIAGRVPEAVVYVLEPIDVDEQRTDEHSRLACRSPEQLLGAVEHQGPGGKPGQRVVESLIGEFTVLLRQLACLLANQ